MATQKWSRHHLAGIAALLRQERQLPDELRAHFRFHRISTGEVYGSLRGEGPYGKASPYRPNSSYSSSKAFTDRLGACLASYLRAADAGDQLLQQLRTFHFPEKLIPLMIINALEGKTPPVYGDGCQIREWLVSTITSGPLRLYSKPGISQVYNVRGGVERRNIDIVRMVCDLLSELRPRIQARYHDLITFVPDRPGHDQRCAIDASRIISELAARRVKT